MAANKYTSSSGYFNKSMQAILKKGEEKAPSKKTTAKKTTTAKKATTKKK